MKLYLEVMRATSLKSRTAMKELMKMKKATRLIMKRVMVKMVVKAAMMRRMISMRRTPRLLTITLMV